MGLEDIHHTHAHLLQQLAHLSEGLKEYYTTKINNELLHNTNYLTNELGKQSKLECYATCNGLPQLSSE